MKALFRIDQVLRGDAPTVALLGTDGDGREVRLEVPSAAVGALRPGGVLVLDWWIGSLPIDTTATVRPSSAPQGAAAEPVITTNNASATVVEPTGAETGATRGQALGDDIDEDLLQAEFRRMFGVIPGFTA
jgi:hypothetical protein